MIDTTQFIIDQPELFQSILEYVDRPETTLTVSHEWYKWTVNFMGRDWHKHFKEDPLLSTFTHPEPASTLALDDCRRHLVLVNEISSRVLQAARPISGGEEKILTTNGRYTARIAEIAKWVFVEKSENLYSLLLCMRTFMPAIRGAADVLLDDPIFLGLTAIQQGEKIREWMREHQEQIIQPVPGWDFDLTFSSDDQFLITAIPEEIAYLHHLKILNIFNFCVLKTMPAQIGRLNQLIELNIHGNRVAFESFPEEISQLNQLKFLSLQNDQLTQLPANITSLQHLRTLNLSHNRFVSFPDELFQIPSLKQIDLSFNQITDLPENFDRLPNLQILNVSDNALEQFPIGIVNLVERQQPTVSDEYPMHLHCDLHNNPFQDPSDTTRGMIDLGPCPVKDTMACRFLCRHLVNWRNPKPEDGMIVQVMKRTLSTVALCGVVVFGIVEIFLRLEYALLKPILSPIISLIQHCKHQGLRRLIADMDRSTFFNELALSASNFKLSLIQIVITIRLIFENIFKETLDFEEIEEQTASYLGLQTSLDDSFVEMR